MTYILTNEKDTEQYFHLDAQELLENLQDRLEEICPGCRIYITKFNPDNVHTLINHRAVIVPMRLLFPTTHISGGSYIRTETD